MKATIKVTNAEIQMNQLSNEPYFTAKVNGRQYVGSIFEINGYNAVSYARNICSTKRTTLQIMCAIEKSLNN